MLVSDTSVASFIETSKLAVFNYKFLPPQHSDWKPCKKLAGEVLDKCQEILKRGHGFEDATDIEETELSNFLSQVAAAKIVWGARKDLCKRMLKKTDVSAFVKQGRRDLIKSYKEFNQFLYESDGSYRGRLDQIILSISGLISGSYLSVGKCEQIETDSKGVKFRNSQEERKLNRFLNRVKNVKKLFNDELATKQYEENIREAQFFSRVAGIVPAIVGLSYNPVYSLGLFSLFGLATEGIGFVCRKNNRQKMQADTAKTRAYIQKIESQQTNHIQAKQKRKTV